MVTTLALGWVTTRGAVRFTIDGATVDQTVKRVVPGGVLQAIRGYPDGSWHGVTGLGYDYEMPMGVTVTYAVVDKLVTTLPVGAVTAAIFTQTPGRTNGEAWLRDIQQPILSQPVTVTSTDDETRGARRTIYEITGRSTPYVVWDSRTSRQGTITLYVENHPTPGVWEVDSPKQKITALLMSGRPLMFSMCASKGFAPLYMAAGDITYTRRGTLPEWYLTIDYVEVDNPVGVGVYPAPEVTYDMASQIPPAALYSDWTPVTYYDIATRTIAP
jgi:hypothetical protein